MANFLLSRGADPEIKDKVRPYFLFLFLPFIPFVCVFDRMELLLFIRQLVGIK